jgi:hypothetical protein
LSSAKKTIVEAEKIDDIADENDLLTEDFAFAEIGGEGSTLGQDESTELAETDFISKLSMLLDQEKAQTKYAALNINRNLRLNSGES